MKTSEITSSVSSSFSTNKSSKIEFKEEPRRKQFLFNVFTLNGKFAIANESYLIDNIN